MKKIDIDYEIISDEKVFFKTKGVLKNNEIIFYDKKVKNKIIFFDKRIRLERSNDFFLELDFIMGKKTKGTYTIDSISYDIDIYTDFLEVSKNQILIDYSLHNDKDAHFKVKITYEFCE